MRSLEYYINESKKKNLIKNKDIIDCITNPYQFLVDLYEDKLNLKGNKTEKKIELIEAFFIDAFKDKKFDPDDKDDSRFISAVLEVFKYLYDKYTNSESAIVFDSLFYKYRDQLPCLFNEKLITMLNSWEDQQFVKAEIAYDCLMNGRIVTNFELDLLYTYLKNHIGEDYYIDEMCDDCFKKLIEDEKSLTRSELSFVLEYMTYRDWDLSSERPHVYINTFENKHKFGESDSDANSVYISSYFVGEPIIDHEVLFDYFEDSYFTLSTTLYHELQHQRQGEYTKKQYMTLSAFQFVCRRLIPRKYGKKFDEYKENYMYKEIETEANIVGSNKSYLLAKKYGLESSDYHYSSFREYVKKLSKSVQVDEFGIASDVVNFNINNLREIVEKDPSLVRKYPVLGAIFKKDGTFKTINELVSDYGKITQIKVSSGLRRLYNYLFKYYLYNSRELDIDLFNIDFDTLDDKLTYLIMLEDYIINEHKSLQNIFDSINDYDLKNENDLKGILYDKVDKLVEAYGIIKQNKILDLVNIVMPSLDNSLDFNKKIKKILFVYLQIKDSNLEEHVKNNPLIANDSEMHSIARRVDAMDKSIARLNNRRKVIKSRNKQPDYIGQIKR